MASVVCEFLALALVSRLLFGTGAVAQTAAVGLQSVCWHMCNILMAIVFVCVAGMLLIGSWKNFAGRRETRASTRYDQLNFSL